MCKKTPVEEQTVTLIDRLRRLAILHASNGQYQREEWIEWEAADMIESLRATVRQYQNIPELPTIGKSVQLRAALRDLIPEGWESGHMDHMPGIKTARLLLGLGPVDNTSGL